MQREERRLKPQDLRLFYEPKERLRLTVGEERSYISVKPVWAAPLSHPNAYLALMNGKGEEITVVQDPMELPSDALQESGFAEQLEILARRKRHMQRRDAELAGELDHRRDERLCGA